MWVLSTGLGDSGLGSYALSDALSYPGWRQGTQVATEVNVSLSPWSLTLPSCKVGGDVTCFKEP